jgi:hypothetical protein
MKKIILYLRQNITIKLFMENIIGINPIARLLCGHNYSFKDKFQLLILHLFFRDKTFPNGQFCAD